MHRVCVRICAASARDWTGALGAQSACAAGARGGLDGSIGREHSEHKAFVLQVLVTEREHWTGALREQLWAF